MKTIGLTGGIGMGKSTSAQLLRARNIPVIDTDDIARQVVEPGQPALEELRQLFGDEIIGRDGRLLRAELARRVFADTDARSLLEGVLHPRIRVLWQAQVQTWRSERKPISVVVIPLLFETGANKELDATVCVACSLVTQMERLQTRGWPPDQIHQRIRAQWPVERKLGAADFVVWTEAGLDVHNTQLDRILNSVSTSRSAAPL